MSPRSLILVAPFSSIATLLETYRLGTLRCQAVARASTDLALLSGNFIPILSPLRNFPWLLDALLRLLSTRFDTKNIIEVRARYQLSTDTRPRIDTDYVALCAPVENHLADPHPPRAK